jgi:hypothetical protein|tara:strand:- start:148 stop:363 length:216 start_codon:yes stop_codon:yes gene_type:complete
MPGDNPNELWDNNELGQVSFKTFYAGKGMEALQNMIRKHPMALEDVIIKNERGNKFSVQEFLELISDYKIK